MPKPELFIAYLRSVLSQLPPGELVKLFAIDALTVYIERVEHVNAMMFNTRDREELIEGARTELTATLHSINDTEQLDQAGTVDKPK